MRTYLRILFNDIFRNNFLITACANIVNFYCKLLPTKQNTLKFSSNMPIKELKEREIISFQSVTGDKIDLK